MMMVLGEDVDVQSLFRHLIGLLFISYLVVM